MAQTGGRRLDTVCPYIGFRDDREVVSSVPSVRHYCHRVSTPQPIRKDVQQKFCLQARFQECPVYRQVARGFPREFRPPGPPLSRRLQPWVRYASPVLLLVVLMLLGYEGFLRGDALSEGSPGGTVPGLAVVPTETLTRTPSPSPTWSPTWTPSPSPTPSPSRTPTPTETALPRHLGVALGLERGFLVYQVQSGDTLDILAQRFGVSREALLQVNPNLPETYLPMGAVLIIPLPHLTLRPLPRLLAYRVPWAMQAQSLVQFLGLEDPAFFYYVNDLAPTDWLNGGDWVLLPLKSGP